MFLKSLTLKGFKSFADRTTMVFDPGLTVVIGPNGSGKSNVSDAVLWVLGEQSARQLRGQAMEDVIFAGSSARAPVGLAEVTLVLDNADHTLPIDFAEVAITRRMYRSGESEYLINGSPCRLMDITDILHDTGLGRDTHSIISQGRLDSILTSRPEERRELVEEAAGVSKHRRRKARSERKLKGMDENLVRAKDVAREIARQLRPLEQQVDKAQRHRALADELQELEATLAVDDLRRLQARHARLTAKGLEADAAVELARYRYEERSRELERSQSLLEQKGLFVGDLGEQRRRMQDLLGRMDADMRLLEEKGRNMVSRLSEMRMALSNGEHRLSELNGELERVSSELTEARARTAELDKQVSELAGQSHKLTDARRELGRRQARLNADQQAAQRESDRETLAYAKLQDQIGNAEVEDQMFASRLAQIDETMATATEAVEEGTRRGNEANDKLALARQAVEHAKSSIDSAQDELKQCRSVDAQAQKQLQSARATLSALKDLDVQGERSSSRVVALMDSEASSKVECRLADTLRVPPDLEALVERLLGDDLAALVTDRVDDAAILAKTAASLQDAAGTATVVARESMQQQTEDEDFAGDSLAQRLSSASGNDAFVEGLFSKIRLVDSVEEAVSAHRQNPSCSYVTCDGVTVLPDGRIIIGTPDTTERGALERKRKIRELTHQMVELEAQATEASAAVEKAEARIGEAREKHIRASGEVSKLAAEAGALASEMGRLESQLSSLRAERAQVAKRRELASERTSAAREEIESHRKAAADAQQRVAHLSEELEQLNGERRSANAEEEAANRRLSEAKLELATISERRNNLSLREEQLARNVRELEERQAATERSARSLEVVRLRVAPLYERYEALRERALVWADLLRDRSRLAEADSQSLKQTIGDTRRAASEAADELEQARSIAADVKVELGRLEVQVENAVASIEATGYVLEEALTLAEPQNREEMERSAESLRRKLAHIGPVNEIAMDEFLRLKERSDYIAEQVADLEAARKALTKITAAIERKMRKQFLAAFEAVNTNFSETFALLFPGGHAHLELCDPDHLDETGIEVVAQPRGKRIQKMMLMSGGEKSLTALALLFAAYKARTVPFYIFDEVEAALDDSNLGKLLDAMDQLKMQTQLIVISHQRRTMEQADVLYGVSMQADGVSHVVSQRLDHNDERVVSS